MAGFGAKYPCFAPMTDAQAETYGSGVVLGKLVGGDLSVSLSSGELWADNIKAEQLDEFASGSIAMETDSLDDEIASIIYGCSVVDGEVTYNKNDTIPYGCLGYYRELMKGGVRYYQAWFFPKVKAQLGNKGAQTRGSSITFTTESITWTVDTLVNGDWHVTETFDTEEEAKAWIDDKCRIVAHYNMLVVSTGEGTVEPSGSVSVLEGADFSVTLSDTPTTFTDNGVNKLSDIVDNVYTIEDVAGDHTIIANF